MNPTHGVINRERPQLVSPGGPENQNQNKRTREPEPEPGSSSSLEVQVCTQLLCSSGGSLPLLDLHRKLLQRCQITEEEFCSMVQRVPRFLLDRGPGPAGPLRAEDCSVMARTSLRLCALYPREGGCSGSGAGAGAGPGPCPNLHLCKYFLFGTCRFGKGR
ncbi:hypothetical protein NQZ68_035813 [Dissostichus eleginoides]|nr:hypothetical protein NQZ68_035813 [Dissostichus eleginoides]